MPDDNVFMTKRNNPGEKLSLLYSRGDKCLREVRPKKGVCLQLYCLEFIVTKWSKVISQYCCIKYTYTHI